MLHLKLKKLKIMILKNSLYYKKSLEIAKEFVQSITIVDDKAVYSNGTPVSSDFFDAGEIIKKFSEQSIICSIFKFTEENDIYRIAKISPKSDITVLDWKMTPAFEAVENDNSDDEEEDNRESKGYYTLEILKEVLSSEYNKFKLFVIYTDEIDFNRIVSEIKQVLKSINLPVKEESQYSFLCNSNKITIFGKEAVKTKTTHIKDIAQRAFNYAELPNAIYEEFVNFTHGVVSNIFLKSISAIRANTFFLLNTFQREIDAAFIAHKSVLPTPDDAHEHIIELIGSEIKSVINGALNESITSVQIENYIELLDEKKLLFNFKKDDLDNNSNIPNSFTIGEFKELLNKGIISTCKYENESVKSKRELSKRVIKHIPKIIIQGYDPTIEKTKLQEHINNSNLRFAKLTTLRKRYLNANKPFLTLGVLLKGTTVAGNDEYWVCIQPKCDSVRLSMNENMHMGRPFMFLSLTKTSKNGDIILDLNTSFKIIYNITKIRQFMFRPTKNGVVQVREVIPNEWFFLDSFGRRFEYLGELKNDFAQGIANSFASQVSRVATNHSEWLRLNSIK